MSTNARFLPWARAAGLVEGSLQVRAAGRDVDVPVARYGPGDVTGLGSGQVRRREPLPGSLGMAPNLFPYLEFARADLPWCLSPDAPDANGGLRPWLALIVVAAPVGSPLGTVAEARQPVIELEQNELPPSDEVGLWAHVQVDAGAAPDEDGTRRGVSRVIAARQLAPNTRYAACLVPTFEAGRLAGLGQRPPEPLSAAPAWGSGPGKVVLPVYDHWFFTTTDTGDLETLARRLRGRDLTETSSPRRLDVSAVSGDVDGRVAPFEGALRPLAPPAESTGAAVDASAQRLKRSLEHAPTDGTAVVGPPVYGSIASGRDRPDPADGWAGELNLDPRRRAAAGLGAELVRAHQDELADEAWRQAGDLERARREREGAVLAELASTRLYARAVAPLQGAHALVTLAPALGRMRESGAPTVAARLAQSALPAPALGAAFRRILATKTAPAVRASGKGLRRAVALQNVTAVSPGSLPATSAKLVTTERVRAGLTPTGPTGPLVPRGPHGPILTHLGPVLTPTPRTGPAHGPVFGGQVIGQTPPVLQPLEPQRPPAAHQPPGGAFPRLSPAILQSMPMIGRLTDRQQTILAEVAPVLASRTPPKVDVAILKPFEWARPAPPSGPLTATARCAGRVTLGETGRLRPGVGVVATPRFTQALGAWLDPQFLMAGVDVPPDTVGLLSVHTEFVESLMVGANHELARELLWRGIPLDRAATYLTRFFESKASAAPRDMSAVSSWRPQERLGSHVSFGERVVLVLRSRLVSRLSETVIFLAKAEMDGQFRRPGTKQLLPVFRGAAGVDTAYFGFEMTPEAMAAAPGWYVVIQELAGAAKFGFDEEASQTISTWNDIGWPSVAVAGGYVAAAARTPQPAQSAGMVWRKNGAHMAGIALQRPIRLSIHASLLLPGGN
ncbi:MAG: hypothetical protein ACOYN0_05270 [Phycisphaerales bacterium]